MNKVLRCIILSSFFVMSMVASVLAAPYDPPVAIATPPIDRALLVAYGEAVHGADIRFTIKEDGSVGDVEVVSSSGSSTLDAAIVDTISDRFRIDFNRFSQWILYTACNRYGTANGNV